MKSAAMRLAELSLLLASADALTLRPARANPNVVGYGINRRDTSPYSTPVYNYFAGFDYTINITVGNPPQPVMVVVDTGSSNLILNSPQSDFCQAGNCTQYGSYDPTKSDTSKWYNNLMYTQYEIETQKGAWITDDVTFGGKTLTQIPIGSGNESSNSDINIWGFGGNGQLGAGLPGIPSNDTTLKSIHKSGVINSASVSIYLNQTGSETGSMLFGGVDTSLYTGTLQTLPVIPRDGFYDRLTVNLTTISYNDGKSTKSIETHLPIRVMLDTGNFDIKLPLEIATAIQKSFGITQQFQLKEYDFALTACSMADSPAVVSFGFGGELINVPMSSLVVNPPESILASYGLPPGTLPEGVCLFLINGFKDELVESGQLVYILGGAFLANAYFVSDEDSQEVGLAQANFNPGPSNILEIAPASGGIAGISNSTTSNSTGKPGGTPTPTGGAVPSATQTGDSMKAWQAPTGWIVAAAGVFGLLLSL
ncbi:hypothetical protein V502_11493 [Pseudogymnoascus sp. VKM F-4520 (FW-2644)]|nr:hypothetical protein V502_11493 [Pseudogymnoascus sp. VKM F-4520 (FW-2644)]